MNVVVVGSGLAGVVVAEALSADPSYQITLVTNERQGYYARPACPTVCRSVNGHDQRSSTFTVGYCRRRPHGFNSRLAPLSDAKIKKHRADEQADTVNQQLKTEGVDKHQASTFPVLCWREAASGEGCMGFGLVHK